MSGSLLHELTFDIVLTPKTEANRALFDFTLEWPGFRRRIQDVRFTRANAWLTILLEGPPAAVDAYEARFGRGTNFLVVEHRPLARGPGFSLAYEKQRAPRRGEEGSTWHLVAKHVGTGARITYDTSRGRSRVRVAHEDAERLREFFRALKAQDRQEEARFVRLGAVAPDDAPPVPAADAEILALAWREGYYGKTRGATVRELAEKSGVPYSTLGYRLRRAEARAVEALLRAEGRLGE